MYIYYMVDAKPERRPRLRGVLVTSLDASCRFRKGSRVRDEEQEKKKEEKKGKRGGQRFGECFFPMKRCAITTEENKRRTRMGWMRLFCSLLVSEIRLCGQMFTMIIWDTRFFEMVKWFWQEKWRFCYDVYKEIRIKISEKLRVKSL